MTLYTKPRKMQLNSSFTSYTLFSCQVFFLHTKAAVAASSEAAASALVYFLE